MLGEPHRLPTLSFLNYLGLDGGYHQMTREVTWTRRNARKGSRFCVVVAVLFCLTFPSIATEENTGSPAKRKNVLILFGSNRPDNHELLDLIEAELRPRVQGPITFYETYLTTNLDIKLYKAYQNSQAETFLQTYGSTDLDLIIAVYPQAVDFATHYRDKMFPGVPIMYTGVGIKNGWELKNWPGVPGASFVIGLSETIDLALRLHPDTKRIAIVAGPDWGWVKEIHSELLRRNMEEDDIIYNEPDREVLQRVAALPPHTIALLHTTLAPSRSDFGSRELISGVSQILPTYSAWEYICVDLGCIGGAYADERKSASSTADIAARILSGEHAENIPSVHNSEVRATVDWRALQRWHVPDSMLPPGTLVLYREPTLWERGRKYFLAALAIIIVQSILIFALFWQQARRREIETELRASEEKFSKAFLHSPLVVTITRASDSRFIDVNESFEEQFGWTRDEVIGRTPEDCSLWVDVDQRAAFLKRVRIDGSVRNLEVRLRTKEGETRTALVSGELMDVGGEPCTVSVAADITERKRAEEVLSSVSRRLIEAQEGERTRLARELHDDINQRLAMLALKLHMLQDSLPAPPEQIRNAITEAGKQTESLADDIHALSHRLHSSKLDYLGLASAAGGFCKELSDHLGVEIGFHSESIPKDLPSDISLCLFRVLQEALQNAIKHSGTKHFHVSLNGGSTGVELKVHDSGIGFDPANAERGNGLGLTSIRERLKLVNGKLFIDSEFLRGTTILACVPLNPQAKSATAS
jgi:PAS domain S-box-containing protein